jgi:hypothetical protein
MQKFSTGKFHGVRPGDTKAIPIPVPLKGATISGYGTQQARVYAAVCPLLAEANMRLLERDSGFDPKRAFSTLFDYVVGASEHQ